VKTHRLVRYLSKKLSRWFDEGLTVSSLVFIFHFKSSRLVTIQPATNSLDAGSKLQLVC
jgi:hypothetical protein